MSDPIDDGLSVPEVGEWAEEKYNIFERYARQFSVSMNGKWDHLIYVDLFAGAGLVRIRGTDRIIRGAALRAMRMKPGFDSFFLCEIDERRAEALVSRARKEGNHRHVNVLVGDCNSLVDIQYRHISNTSSY